MSWENNDNLHILMKTTCATNKKMKLQATQVNIESEVC